MKKPGFVLIILLGVSLILSACGSAGGASTNLNIIMTDFKFEPVQNTIPAGKEITLKLTNDGAVLHEYVIMKLGQTVGEKFGPEDEENIYWEAEVDTGETATVTFTAPSEPGEYEIVCGTEGHLEAGMVGKLFVVAE